jgi:hypothetical protein
MFLARNDSDGSVMAEGVGFEPTDPCGSPVFKTGALNRSAIPPLFGLQTRFDSCSTTLGQPILVACCQLLPQFGKYANNGSWRAEHFYSDAMTKEKKLSKPVTAAELDEKLNQGPDNLSLKEQQEKHLRALREQLAKAEQPLVGGLIEAGISVKSIWDLVNTKQSCPGAIPILKGPWKAKASKGANPYRTCFGLSSPAVGSEGSQKTAEEVKKMKRLIQKLFPLDRDLENPEGSEISRVLSEDRALLKR